MQTDSFVLRHLGPKQKEVQEMLETVGVSSMDELIFNNSESTTKVLASMPWTSREPIGS